MPIQRVLNKNSLEYYAKCEAQEHYTLALQPANQTEPKAPQFPNLNTKHLKKNCNPNVANTELPNSKTIQKPTSSANNSHLGILPRPLHVQIGASQAGAHRNTATVTIQKERFEKWVCRERCSDAMAEAQKLSRVEMAMQHSVGTAIGFARDSKSQFCFL